MIPPPDSGAPPDRGGWLGELNRLDLAVYAAIAATPSPALDRAFRRLSRAADHSKLWLASAAVLATAGGARGRRAAVNGLASTAVTSAVVNLVLKLLGARLGWSTMAGGLGVADLGKIALMY